MKILPLSADPAGTSLDPSLKHRTSISGVVSVAGISFMVFSIPSTADRYALSGSTMSHPEYSMGKSNPSAKSWHILVILSFSSKFIAFHFTRSDPAAVGLVKLFLHLRICRRKQIRLLPCLDVGLFG